MFDRQARTAFVILCISLLVCGAGFRAAIGYLNISLQKHRVDLREHFASIPRTLGEWKASGDDIILDEAMVESLGTTQYLDRTYVRQLDRGRVDMVQVHLAYYTGMIDAVPHVPDRCMQAGGMDQRTLPSNLPLPLDTSRWAVDPNTVHRKSGEAYPTTMFAHHITAKPIRVHLPLGEFQLRTTEFAMPTEPDARIFAGYFFIANGVTTPAPGGVKKLAFDPREKYAYYCKVQFTMVGGDDLDESAFVRVTTELTNELLPHIMACLPDWPEVEQRMEREADVATTAAPEA